MLAKQQQTFTTPNHSEVLVVGGGPVGVRVGQLLSRRGLEVTLLSEEHHDPYNRVRLTPLLGGDVQFRDLALQSPEEQESNLSIRTNCRVVEIDRDECLLETADGQIWSYGKLVIATGSRAFVPAIPGAQLPGVFSFRTADDVSALMARSFAARKVTVIGGGLLGLEAARGLAKRGCHVTVIEHEDRLMPRQLDKAAAEQLETQIEALGVAALTSARVAEILGDSRVQKVVLADETEIECDTVVICAGVKANVELVRKAGLGFDRGILVNAQMQTRDPQIFAIGECAQFGTQVVGLVGPGYVQAEVAAAAICGESTAYVPTLPATKLKVIGADVISVGPVEQLEAAPNVTSHIWKSGDAYRRVFVERGKLVGVIAVGNWDQASRMQEAAQSGLTVYPWILFRFRKTGSFWSNGEVEVADLPAAATICNCTGVNCGQIRAAIEQGARTQEVISAETGAGTVCGTCKPLLEELVDAGGPPQPVLFSKPLIGFSVAASVTGLMPLLFGYVPMPASYDAESLRLWLWRDNIVKQWSGFILLGIIFAAMLIGMRKRLRFMDRLGSYDGWRLAHILIGLFAVGGFFVHTGFRMGTNWNFLLGLFFLLTLIMGAVAGLTTGGDHSLRARGIGTARKPAKRIPMWLHILAIWPLPILILFHVLTIYAF